MTVEQMLERKYQIKEGADLEIRHEGFLKWRFEDVGGQYELDHVFTLSPNVITHACGAVGVGLSIVALRKVLNKEQEMTSFAFFCNNPGDLQFLPWHQVTTEEVIVILKELIPDFYLPGFLLEKLQDLADAINASMTPYYVIRNWWVEQPKRRVVCAANRVRHESLEDGELIVPSTRHYGTFMNRLYKAAGIDRFSNKEIKQWDSEQGFIDQWGDFMTREEAYVVAKRNKQILKDREHISDRELFSEMLY